MGNEAWPETLGLYGCDLTRPGERPRRAWPSAPGSRTALRRAARPAQLAGRAAARCPQGNEAEPTGTTGRVERRRPQVLSRRYIWEGARKFPVIRPRERRAEMARTPCHARGRCGNMGASGSRFFLPVKKLPFPRFSVLRIRPRPTRKRPPHAPFVYRLGRQIFILKRGVRLP
jgi:hypothetical protein